jgi:peptidoglycan biosynthesis protein MviN/MurJ (putative lipid II flippase)
MASADARNLVQLALLGISAGVVGGAALNLGTQAAYARSDARSPLRAVALRAVLSVAGMLAALWLVSGPPFLLAGTLVIAGSDVLAGAWLCLRVRRGLPDRGTGLWAGLGRTLLATLAMAPVVLGALAVLPPASGRAGALLAVVAAGVLGAAVYVTVQHRLRSPDLAGLTALVGRRRAG